MIKSALLISAFGALFIITIIGVATAFSDTVVVSHGVQLALALSADWFAVAFILSAILWRIERRRKSRPMATLVSRDDTH